MRAALYVRLSHETDVSTSPARQREVGEAYAAARGWQVVNVYEDIDVSASARRLDRPALGRLRDSVAAGDVDVVIVWRLDRLARSVLDTLTLFQEWQQHGCAVASATEGIDLTTPHGKAMATLIAVFAEMEAAAISERARMSVDKLRRERRFSGGTVPFGYTTAPRENGPGVGLVVLDDEAEVVREVARRLLAGEGPARISRDLNTRRVPAPRCEYRRLARQGKPTDDADRGTWTRRTLARLMISPHIAGWQTHRGEPITAPSGLPEQVWEPLVTPAVLSALRDHLEPRGVSEPPRRAARALSGIVRCGACGTAMVVRHKGASHIGYACPASGHGKACPGMSASAPAVEEHVAALALERLGNMPLMESVPVLTEGAVGVSFADVERALRDTTAAMLADDADVAALSERLAALKATRAGLRERGQRPARLNVLRPTGETWAERWEREDTDGRRRLLGEWVERVEVHSRPHRGGRFSPDRVAVLWRAEPDTAGAAHAVDGAMPAPV